MAIEAELRKDINYKVWIYTNGKWLAVRDRYGWHYELDKDPPLGYDIPFLTPEEYDTIDK